MYLISKEALGCKDCCYRLRFITLPITLLSSIPLQASIMIFQHAHVMVKWGVLFINIFAKFSLKRGKNLDTLRDVDLVKFYSFLTRETDVVGDG